MYDKWYTTRAKQEVIDVSNDRRYETYRAVDGYVYEAIKYFQLEQDEYKRNDILLQLFHQLNTIPNLVSYHENGTYYYATKHTMQSVETVEQEMLVTIQIKDGHVKKVTYTTFTKSGGFTNHLQSVVRPENYPEVESSYPKRKPKHFNQLMSHLDNLHYKGV